MNPRFQKRILLILFFVFLLSSLKMLAYATTFYGTVPTGLLELTEYRYPVYLFVPPNYKPDRDYPFLISVPDEGESPEENIKFWMGRAKRKSMILLSASNLRPEDLPTKMDDWLLSIKRDVSDRYRTDNDKTYLIGMNGGAQYASYLGMNYPEQFSAVAALGGSWAGKYEKLLRMQKRPRKQVPFFVALKDDQKSLFESTRKIAFELEKKGYPIYLVKMEDGEDFASNDFKEKVLDWLDEKSRAWKDVVAESKKPLKEKISMSIEDFFHL